VEASGFPGMEMGMRLSEAQVLQCAGLCQR
jgi:hypothetical protein